jgi:hypothetical protein
LNIDKWQVAPGVPDSDIIWFNVNRILTKKFTERSLAFIKPLTISIAAMFVILLIEKFLIWLGWVSALLLSITSTCAAVLVIYVVPWLVH